MPKLKTTARKNPRANGKLKFTPEFLKLVAGGDESCFEEIYLRGLPVLVGYLRSKRVPAQPAEVYARDALTNFWLGITARTFDPDKTDGGDMLPYLITIAKHTRAEGIKDWATRGLTRRPVKELTRSEIKDDPKRKPKAADVIEMKRRGYSYREIAELTGYPLGTVKAIISRARKK